MEPWQLALVAAERVPRGKLATVTPTEMEQPRGSSPGEQL